MGNTFGYISGYNFKSDGSFSGTNNSLDSSGKNTNIYINIGVFLFENVWGIKSPNQNDQILVMTNDDAYISYNSYIISATNRIFTDYFALISPEMGQITLYLSLYFILVHGFYGNSAKTSLQFIAILQMFIPTTALVTNPKANVAQRPVFTLNNLSPTSTPSYTSQITTLNKLGSSQAIDRLIRDCYYYYIVCTDLAENDSKSSYYNVLDPRKTIISDNNIKSSDWKYAANYFYTIYILAPITQPKFCFNPAPLPPDVKRDDSPLVCDQNKSGSSLINTPSGPYGQGGAAAWAVNNKMTVVYIVVGLLLCISMFGSLIFVMISSSKKSRQHKNSGGYFYLE
jgi:hypothetical protein